MRRPPSFSSTMRSRPGMPRRLTMRRGCQQALFHQVEKVDAARLITTASRFAWPPDATMAVGDCGRRRVAASAADDAFTHSNAVHRLSLPRGMRPSAESTAAGFIGKLPQPHADRVVDGVGDRRRGGDACRLGDAVGVGRAAALVVFQEHRLRCPAPRAAQAACTARDWRSSHARSPGRAMRSSNRA